MRKIFEIVTTFPKTTILSFFLLTLLFYLQLSKVRMETDAEAMIPHDNPAIIYDDKVEEIFGINDTIIIGIVNEEDNGIFNADTLGMIKRLTENIGAIDGIVAVTNDDVTSLSTIDNIIGTEFGFDVSPFMEEAPKTDGEISDLKTKFYANGLYVGSVVSKDGTAAAIYAELESGVKNRMKVYQEVRALVDEELKDGGPDKIYIAGRPVLEVTYGKYMSEDMGKMMPLVIVTIIIVLFFTFRNLSGVLLPLSVVIGSVIWTMGIMALCNVPMFPISTQMPIILMAIGIADGIHILNRYFQESSGNNGIDRKELILQAMDEIWKPVVMTSLTTAVGFVSLVTAYMVPIRYFGVFTAIGILAAMIFSLLLIPACLMLFKVKTARQRFNRKGKGQYQIENSIFNKVLATTGAFVYDKRIPVTVVSGVIIVISIFGLTQISTNSSWIENVKHSSDIYIANKVMNEKFDGTLTLYAIVEGGENGAIKSPDILKKIDMLQAEVEELSLVGGSRSIAEYLKQMNRVMNEDKESFEIVPDTRPLVAQYLLMYSMSGDPDDFDDIVDYDYRMANIWVQVKSDYTDDTGEIISRVEAFAEKHFADTDVTVNLAGKAYVSWIWVDLLIRGQMRSVFFSVIAVFIITALMFRSIPAGLFNIVPISVAMLMNFGIMALLGYPLDVSTALSSGIVIGVGIDYTIHFLSKYRLEANRLKDGRKAMVAVMTTTGRAIFFNAIAVIAGFMVLFASNFPANQHLGGLVSINMFTCFVAAITILPALLNIIKPKFINR